MKDKSVGHIMLTTAVAIVLGVCVTQQAGAKLTIYGTPGSPSATTTIDGKQLPPPAPPFGGVIKDNAVDSTAWWPPRVVPPKDAPNILLIMTDDAGFGVPSTFGGVIPTPTLDRVANDGRMIDSVPLDLHVGSIAIRRFIEERQPLLTLHGHIHESARLTGSWRDRLGRTHAFGAAHDGPELALVQFDLSNLGAARRDLV